MDSLTCSQKPGPSGQVSLTSHLEADSKAQGVLQVLQVSNYSMRLRVDRPEVLNQILCRTYSQQPDWPLGLGGGSPPCL